MKRLLMVATALVAVTVTGGGAVSATPNQPQPEPEPGTWTEDGDLFGMGVSGSRDYSIPDCPTLTSVDVQDNQFVCVPTSSPMPQGTEALPLVAQCPVPTGTNVEGFFTDPSQMRQLAACVLPLAREWLAWEYQSDTLTPPAEWIPQSASLLPNNFVYIPSGIEGPSGCSDRISDRSLAYCSFDGNIYLGEQALWRTYSRGDADVWSAIAHEMGHRVQHVANFRAMSVDNDNESIPRENQADCFSGAFMTYAARFGRIDTVATGDDLIDLFNGVFNIGEQEGVEQTHGTIDQRVRAFFVGYNSSGGRGVFDCEFFITDVSIVPQAWGGDPPPPLGPQTQAVLLAQAAPAPTVPAPTVPTPTVPAPTVPAPTVPAPTVPAPTVPAPTVPAPTVPAPTVPAPTVPAPAGR